MSLSLQRCSAAPSARAGARRASVVVVAAQKPNAKGGKKAPTQTLQYGDDWYKRTRELANSPRTVREEIEYRRMANLIANNGKERKDLYTENWAGSEYRGSPWNIGTLVAALFVLTPVAGLLFAWFGYGIYWG
ncbi:hypothetical protein HYH03_008117 [Edaphochlamys debaryana]|uniref:Uncharacterized protein n=1 Tax=Edaphochlamys debaryana TaxID=47281 RepID=A0A836BZP0_9CHLO|nr:hypothetical protein HYH03_008117 [Edaphochlamys debaryana]|eukprot:KAG2493599.1 hypothetical protein HYH03_008117 [Edaphochlamys debaryana]